MIWLWIAVAFCVVAVVGSLAYAAVHAWRLWRAFRDTSRRAGDAVARVATAAAAAEQQARGATADVEKLTGAAERLQVSLAELAVLRSAAAEPQALLAALRGAVPRK
jgi:hypothetical protein